MAMGDSNFEWPSKRVPQGGIFHPPKVTYSKQTQDLLKLLMDEAHLTMLQRNKINYHLRNGDPLPPPVDPQKSLVSDDENMQAYHIIMKVKGERKRSLDVIRASGAYEPEKYVPTKYVRETSEKAKTRLQEIMSGVKDFPEMNSMNLKNKYKHKVEKKRNDWPDPMTEILNEIYERADWLAEMEELGEGKKHRDIIQAQIAERLREIKRLESERNKLIDYEQLEHVARKMEKLATRKNSKSNP